MQSYGCNLLLGYVHIVLLVKIFKFTGYWVWFRYFKQVPGFL